MNLKPAFNIIAGVLFPLVKQDWIIGLHRLAEGLHDGAPGFAELFDHAGSRAVTWFEVHVLGIHQVTVTVTAFITPSPITAVTPVTTTIMATTSQTSTAQVQLAMWTTPGDSVGTLCYLQSTSLNKLHKWGMQLALISTVTDGTMFVLFTSVMLHFYAH